MTKPLELLVVEDDHADYALVARDLRSRLGEVKLSRVDNAQALANALRATKFDVVISDYHLPGLSFEEVFGMVHRHDETLPVILLSGSLGEEAAVDLLKMGLSDFVLKDSLLRLAPAVRRAVEDRAEHAARRAAEMALRQSQKLEAMGQLAGGVAHDFNNLLCVIGSAADMAITALQRGEQVFLEDLQEIKKASDRAASLTRQLLALSRRQVMEASVVDVRRLVHDLDKLLRRLIPEDIDLRVLRGTEVSPVCVDPGQLEQVIVNLVVNARDALSERGTIEVAVRAVERPARGDTSASAKLVPWVSITVSDDGCGMTDEVKQRMFEPFFTTKERGKGTGLGLATVRGIVEQSGGVIEVWSELGRGTRFEVLLPACEAPTTVDVPVRAPHAPSSPRGQGRILLVEDEAAVRAAMRRILEAAGYHVVIATQGEEALELSASGPIADLLITDMVMPKMSGLELVEHLERRGRKPRAVLFMSGHLDRSLDTRELGANAQFLQKPFTASSLTARVRDVLDGWAV